MNRKFVAIMIAVALVFGAAGSIMLNRWVIPYLSTAPGFGWVAKLHSNAPIVITRREEVRLNEGVNLIELTKQAQTFTVSIYSSGPDAKYLGNGIIVASDGLIFSVKDIMPVDGNVNVVLDNGTVYPGLVRALDPKSPLAIISIQASGLPVAQFSNAGNMQIAQRVFVLGKTNQSFTRSFVSGLVSRTMSNNVNTALALSTESFAHTITTDADVSVDYLGGPVVNLQGLVVGLSVGNTGQILPTEAIDGAMKTYLSGGAIVRPYIGFEYMIISPNESRVRNLPAAGAVVTKIVASSPAAAAGLLAQDVVVEVNGQKVSDTSLEQLLAAQGMNEMRLQVRRGVTDVELTLVPVAR